MVAGVIISTARLREGVAVAQITDSQEGGVDGVSLRRRATVKTCGYNEVRAC